MVTALLLWDTLTRLLVVVGGFALLLVSGVTNLGEA